MRVIDGDTIVLTNTNTRVRLNGVDAPEVVHPGYEHDDDFGPEARAEMRSIIGDAIVRCELNGERSHERLVGVCFLPDRTDIGAEIIRRGLALDCRVGRSGAIADSSQLGSGTSSDKRRIAAHDPPRRRDWQELAADWRLRANPADRNGPS